ncbi:hypothetical protein [Streptomyces sp. NPDC048411]|uniref:hypothetical protein n=1 Tax=Streptomyces sp. NPDC048411 TaxID=3157206 RepID=UPI00345323B3
MSSRSPVNDSVAAVPAIHQELDRATVRGTTQRGEFVHGVGNDAGRARGVEDVVAYARVAAGPAGNDVGQGQVVTQWPGFWVLVSP